MGRAIASKFSGQLQGASRIIFGTKYWGIVSRGPNFFYNFCISLHRPRPAGKWCSAKCGGGYMLQVGHPISSLSSFFFLHSLPLSFYSPFLSAIRVWGAGTGLTNVGALFSKICGSPNFTDSAKNVFVASVSRCNHLMVIYTVY